MGQSQSKSNEPKIKGIGMNQNQFDILDLIATNYITTQNFKDLTNLIKPEYCNKLVILTTDVIKNYLKETKLEYLAKNGEGGNNKLKKEDIIYIQSKSKEDVLSENRQGGGFFDEDDDDDDYLGWMEKKYNHKKPSDEKENKKLTLSYLDVKPSDKKQRMCIGIAKFYVTIAHLWSAILLSVNPQYKYTDGPTGKKKFVSFENRKDLQKDNIIERNVKVELTTENSLCDQRVNVLKHKNMGGYITSMITPIVKVSKGKKIISFYNLEDYKDWKDKHNAAKGWHIKYYKGLGTSNTKEAKEYFRDIKDVTYTWSGEESDISMNLAFKKDQADKRKGWLKDFQPETHKNLDVN